MDPDLRWSQACSELVRLLVSYSKTAGLKVSKKMWFWQVVVMLFKRIQKRQNVPSINRSLKKNKCVPSLECSISLRGRKQMIMRQGEKTTCYWNLNVFRIGAKFVKNFLSQGYFHVWCFLQTVQSPIQIVEKMWLGKVSMRAQDCPHS